MLKYRPLVYWGLVKWHHVALWTRNLWFESIIPSYKDSPLGESFVWVWFQPPIEGTMSIIPSTKKTPLVGVFCFEWGKALAHHGEHGDS